MKLNSLTSQCNDFGFYLNKEIKLDSYEHGFCSIDDKFVCTLTNIKCYIVTNSRQDELKRLARNYNRVCNNE